MKNPKDKNTNINSKKKKTCRLMVGATKLGVEGYMIHDSDKKSSCLT